MVVDPDGGTCRYGTADMMVSTAGSSEAALESKSSIKRKWNEPSAEEEVEMGRRPETMAPEPPFARPRLGKSC
jgi:hypothetical protein